jgi:hypothetical protein
MYQISKATGKEVDMEVLASIILVGLPKKYED